jgi:hypothetical protein
MGGKKAGGGFLGVGGQSGFLNTGLFSSGPQKLKGFDMSQDAKLGESEAIARQRDIASGKAPSISQMMFNQNLDQGSRQAMALAASQRGASNPMLAFRQAQLANQQNNLEGAQQGAILAEQERRAADQFLQQTAAAQRGVALNAAQANMQSTLQNQSNQLGAISGVGQSMASIYGKSNKKEAHDGELVPGKPVVEGDSPKNDTKPYMLSPGEVVIPRTASKDPGKFVDFVQGLEEEHGDNPQLKALIAAAKELKERENKKA